MTRLLICLFFAFAVKQVSAQSMESVMTTDHLRYKPQIPDSNTYKIIKNTSGTPVSTSVLEKMNLYRRHDVDYLWVVNSDIEILVYYVNKMVTHPKNTSGK